MNPLVKEITTVSAEYLGPAAERFILRQIKGHLDIDPEDLSLEHLDKLARWVEISAGLIIDKEKAKELAEKIKEIR